MTWDQRGFGNSTRRSGRYGPEPAVGDLLGLLDHLDLDCIQLIGQSMGGWVAMGFALRHSERLRSLVLTDTLAGVFTSEIGAALQSAQATGPRLSAAEVGNHPALGAAFRRDRPELAFLYQEISSMGDKPEDAAVLAMLGAMRTPLDEVERLDLPALLVVGDGDQLCPPAAMALIAKRIPGAELQVISGAGHSPYFERPERWSRVVGDFLARHSSG